jgi:hypothetical protein
VDADRAAVVVDAAARVDAVAVVVRVAVAMAGTRADATPDGKADAREASWSRT